jgi:hypothetical protein
MKKVVFPLYLLLFVSHWLFAGNGDKANMTSGRQPAVQSENAGADLRKQSMATAPMLIASCDLTTYQSATILGAGDFPYTSGTGITVSVNTNVGTLANQSYTCNGNSFSTAPTAWWINVTEHFIILNFSAPVTSFSMVMNGCNDTEVFTFTPATGTVGLDNFCTAAFEVVGAGNQLRCNASGTNGTLVRINNPTGSTQYTITHNGLLAGSRISLLDCYVGGPVPEVDPESNVQACGTETVPQITFTGTAGATFNWTNNNTAIGLAASGTGNIASFTAANVTSQQVATITVTPVLGAETGTPITFTITAKPKPTLTLGTIMGPVTCGGFNGSIAFTTTNVPNGIYSLSYTGPGSPQNVIVSGNALLLSGRSAGTYSNFSISVNGCAGTVAGPVNLTDPSYTWYRDMDGDTFGNPAMTQQACSPPVGYVANNTDCDDNDPLEKPGQIWYDDTDNDGYGQTGASPLTQCLRPTGYRAAVELLATSGDCNDNNAAIKPGATEVCDGVDNDCDGSIDEGAAPITWYRDMDGDGFGNLAVTQQACTQPSGYVANSTDCNDNNFNIKPGATEICDGVDNDCDGSTDEGVLTTWYRDMDGDTFGNLAVTQQACSQPTGYVANSTDCNDNNPLEKPGQVWYRDTDNDGYAQSGSALTQCSRPVGYKVAGELTATTGDCNDNASNVNPGATEVCDGQDNNCNTITDENVTTTYYRDMDGDGFGNPANTTMACSLPTGYVTNSSDCNDGNAAINPNTIWYLDADNDNYYTGTGMTQCASPGAGYRYTGLTAGSDCNDGIAAINPGATETCNGVDDDCDGTADDGITFVTYYQDSDNDGFGNPSMSQSTCNGAPTGYVTNDDDCDDNVAALNPNTIWYLDADNDNYYTGTGITQCASPGAGYRYTGLTAGGDCNDGNSAINPGATEICNGIDDDCDGTADDGITYVTYYQDNDGDGFGNPAMSQSTCNGAPNGYVANNTDCDDTNDDLNPNTVWYLDADNDNYYTGAGITQCTSPGAGYRYSGLSAGGDCNDGNSAINPAATEICDGIDNDCDSLTDEGVQTTYYADTDNDGFGDLQNTTMACSLPTGYVINSSDCNDGNAAINPNTIWYLDADNDNYYTGTGITQCASPGVGYRYTGLTAGGDCNDGNAAINPAATEICDGVDNDCDSLTDEGVQTTYYADTDNDGFGDLQNTTMACSLPTGYVTNSSDCNDGNAAINPNTIWYLDADNDNYYTGTGMTQCASPGAGYRYTGLLGGGDCNDGNSAINPGATEVCNGIDDDCDGTADDGITYITYYQDNDGDGFGNPAMSQSTCDGAPMGYVAISGDCDDTNDDLNPNTVWYLDADNDNYYTGTGITQCASPGAGYRYTGLTAGGDCNDGNAAINPAATEVCDGIDNDCDSSTDEGVQTTYYRDMDGDTFGDPANTTMACSLPTGYVANSSDCNDGNAAINPNTIWYLDADNDNYYTGTGITQCASPGAGYRYTGLTAGGDCNDGNAAINPAATEICDGIDNDCDSLTDEGVQTTYYRDMDGDTFGDPANTTMACSLPTGYVTNSSDCNDGNSALNPNTIWYLDADGDGYYTGASVTQCVSPGAGYRYTGLLGGGDCNDGNSAINPGATEVCNGIDDDCDGSIDEGVQTTYYADTDNDGFGDPQNTTMACLLPTGYVTNSSDCNDGNSALNPNTIWYLDADGDNYYTGMGITQCASPGAGYRYTGLLGGGDCNDGSAAINPAATEVCDGIDNDCDGLTDEGVQTTYYRDIDGDSFGNPAVTTMACSLPTGYVTNSADCNDGNAALNPNTVWYLDADGDGYYTGASVTQCTSPGAGYRYTGLLGSGDCNDGNDDINPAATEICDGIDNDCDGSTDEGVQTIYYADTDTDGFGNPQSTIMACSLPTGYVANNSDCNDGNAALNPNTIWYLDADNDNYYTGSGITQCASPGAGYRYTGLLGGGDCNDGNAAINPGASEICNGIDDDCDGLTDVADPDLMSSPLEMSCPATQTLNLSSTCSATLPDYRSLVNISGGCGTVTVTQMPASGTSVSQAGPMTVTIMASDQSGSTQSCTFTVNKLDVTPPSVVCFNGSVSFNGQSTIALDADVLSDVADGCGIQSISLSPSTISATQVGQNVPVTVTVTDINGNTASCNSVITVSGLPEGWSQSPDGVGCAGGNSIAYNTSTGVWTATSTNCYYASPFTLDETAFAQRSLCGDGSITALITSINGTGWAGLVMRESNAPGAKKAQLMTNLSQFHRREFRTAANAQAQPQQFASNGRYWLRIVRAGNQFTMFASANGTSWFPIGAQNIVMGSCIPNGLDRHQLHRQQHRDGYLLQRKFHRKQCNAGITRWRCGRTRSSQLTARS